MAENPRLWASLPLVGAAGQAHHAVMAFYLLLFVLLALALLAPHYGVDTRDGRDWQVRP